MNHAKHFKENKDSKETYICNEKDRSEISRNPKQNETLTRRAEI